jgi:hypothetical protein
MREDHDTGPIERLLRDDHARLDTLLTRATDDAGAYAEFRKGLCVTSAWKRSSCCPRPAVPVMVSHRFSIPTGNVTPICDSPAGRCVDYSASLTSVNGVVARSERHRRPVGGDQVQPLRLRHRLPTGDHSLDPAGPAGGGRSGSRIRVDLSE